MVQCLARLLRKKVIEPGAVEDSPLARQLTALDLTFLGIASTVGGGVYIVVGQTAKSEAGPSVIASVVIAGMVALLSALSYAEFGARVPRAGSAYTYAYITIGEFLAFIIGWNLILEYIVGAATMARTFSSSLDALTNFQLSAKFKAAMPIDAPGFAPYPEWIAFFVVLAMSGVLISGVRYTALVNSVCTIAMLVGLLYAFICGLFRTDRENWYQSTQSIPPDESGQIQYGDGGFVPYGARGIFTGAATCFFIMIGFDVVSTAGEEVDQPSRNLPLAMLLTVGVSLLVAFVMAIIVTLLVPYFQLPDVIPLALTFDLIGWPVAKYIVLVGSLFALLAGLIATLFPAPRIIYAMASDGVLFKIFGSVQPQTSTPVYATILSGSLTALLALLMELTELVNMLSIGFLLAYTMVSICVLVLRYDSDQDLSVLDMRYDSMCVYFRKNPFSMILYPFDDGRPSQTSAVIVKCLIFLFVVTSVAIAALLSYSDVYLNSWWSILLLILLIICALAILGAILRQPQSQVALPFKVPYPLVPILPVLSIFVNIFIMFQLSEYTWLRLAAWMLLGFLVYFLYGMWFSLEEDRLKKRFESAQDHVQFDPMPVEPLGYGRRYSASSSEFSLGDDRGRGAPPPPGLLTHRLVTATEKSKLVIGQ